MLNMKNCRFRDNDLRYKTATTYHLEFGVYCFRKEVNLYYKCISLSPSHVWFFKIYKHMLHTCPVGFPGFMTTMARTIKPETRASSIHLFTSKISSPQSPSSLIWIFLACNKKSSPFRHCHFTYFWEPCQPSDLSLWCNENLSYSYKKTYSEELQM